MLVASIASPTIRANAEFGRKPRPFELIFRRMHAGDVQWISSEALAEEINRKSAP
jgi:hypothetical protein